MAIKTRKCMGPECERPVMSKGLCKAHYQQQYKGNELVPIKFPRKEPELCRFDGCTNYGSRLKLCPGHYNQHRAGKTLAPLRKQRPKGTTNGTCTCGALITGKGAKRCRECDRWVSIKGLYNLSKEDYAAILGLQGGCCALCRRPADTFPKSLGVDHDHSCCPGRKSCGECVRGLLCDDCNHGLGKLRDSAELLIRAAEYIKSGGVVGSAFL